METEQNRGNWQWAVQQMDSGKKITREAWSDTSAYIRKVDFHSPTESFGFRDATIPAGTWPPCLALHLSHSGGTKDRWQPYAPTQVDMLAHDWVIIP